MLHAGCAGRVGVLMIVALCRVGLWDDSSGCPSVCVGFLWTVVRGELSSRLAGRSGEDSLPFS